MHAQLRRFLGATAVGLAIGGLAGVHVLGDAPEAPRAAPGDGTLAFEENRGQSDDAVRFLTRGQAYSVFLTDEEMVVARGPEAPVVRARFEGARTTPAVNGEDRLSGVVNVLKGQDPAGWVTGAQRFGRVRYDDLYEGVDLVCYGAERRLQYDFEVAPGVDPETIRIRFSGQDRLELDAQGNLLLHGGAEPLVHERPVLFQHVDGEQVPVDGGFRIVGDDAVAFDVGAYDRDRTLVIDPTVTYLSFLGGDQGDEIHGIWVAPDGSRYVSGETASTDFPGAGQAAVDFDLFCTKLTPDGTAIDFTTIIGSSGEESSAGLVVDPTTLQPIIAGQARAADYPTQNAFQGGFGGIGPPDTENFQFGDAVVTRLTADGTGIVFSTFIGGEWGELCHDIALGPRGEIVVCGRTDSGDFPLANPVRGRSGGLPSGNADAWCTKLAGDGTVIFSTYFGGAIPHPPGNSSLSLEHFTGVAMDRKGDVWLTGWSNSDDFPTTVRTPVFPLFEKPNFTLEVNGVVIRPTRPNFDVGTHDMTLVKMHRRGGRLLYSRFLGSLGSDFATDIALDHRGNIYITGQTFADDEDGFPVTPNAFQPMAGGSSDAFLIIMNKTGKKQLYGTFLGGTSSENGNTDGRLAVDAAGRIHLTGRTSSDEDENWPLVNETDGEARSFESFLTTFTPLGATGVQFSTFLGARFTDTANAITVDSGGAIHIGGQTLSPDLATTQDAVESVYQGSPPDGFGTGDGMIATFDVELGALSEGRAKIKRKVNVGKSPVGVLKTKKLVIKNLSGSAAIRLTIGEPAAPFSVESGGGTVLIPPRGKHVVLVGMTPAEPGKLQGTLQIATSDPRLPDTEVTLVGKGK